MSRPRILVQLDADPHASLFDAVVAVDAGVEHLFQYHQVRPEAVRSLVYGAIFTRGPADLQQTAIFIGGSDVQAGEQLLHAVTEVFFGPMRVSVMLDANGANTTAAAAVVAAGRHLAVKGARALVLAGTGPVGQRAARLLAAEGAQVRLASRDRDRAAQACAAIATAVGCPALTPVATGSADDLSAALDQVQLVIAAGAAGVSLLPRELRRRSPTLRVAIDLNAVPPAGIEGIEVADAGQVRDGVICYGAVGVGGTKMRLHKACLRRLFEDNSLVLDAEAIYQLGCQLS